MNTELFKSLESPLELAQWYVKRRTLEQAVQAAQTRLETFLTSSEVAMEKCFQWILSHVPENVGADETKFENALAVIETAFRNRTGTNSYLRTVQAQWVEMVLPFCVMDVEAFEKAFRSKHKAVDIEKETIKLQKAVQKAKDALVSHTEAAYLLFAEEVENPQFVAEQFVAFWKNNSRMYVAPATPGGKAIHSLGEAKEMWLEAYTLLGFDKLSKTSAAKKPILVRKLMAPELPTSIQ